MDCGLWLPPMTGAATSRLNFCTPSRGRPRQCDQYELVHCQFWQSFVVLKNVLLLNELVIRPSSHPRRRALLRATILRIGKADRACLAKRRNERTLVGFPANF